MKTPWSLGSLHFNADVMMFFSIDLVWTDLFSRKSKQNAKSCREKSKAPFPVGPSQDLLYAIAMAIYQLPLHHMTSRNIKNICATFVGNTFFFPANHRPLTSGMLLLQFSHFLTHQNRDVISDVLLFS